MNTTLKDLKFYYTNHIFQNGNRSCIIRNDFRYRKGPLRDPKKSKTALYRVQANQKGSAGRR